MSYNRCKDIRKFGNKYLPSAYKTQVEFGSHFREKVCLMVRETWYLPSAYKTQVEFRSNFLGEKSASYDPRNTVLKTWSTLYTNQYHTNILNTLTTS